MFFKSPYIFALTLFTTLMAGVGTAMAADLGPLDQPLPVSSTQRPGKPGAVSLQGQSVAQPTNPVAAQNQLRVEVAQEQRELEKLDRTDLLEKVKTENAQLRLYSEPIMPRKPLCSPLHLPPPTMH